jgi:Protein of unknown function (DUF1016).
MCPDHPSPTSNVDFGILCPSCEAHDAARGDSPENGLVAARRKLRRMFVSVASTLHVVSEKYPGEVYGSKFFDKLGVDLRRELPDASGFSKVNLIYCLKFYELYSGCTIVPQLVEQSAKSRRGAAKMPQLVAEWGHRQLADGNLQQVVAQLVSVPWGHHRTIIDKCKDDRDRALFYVRRTIQNGCKYAGSVPQAI